MLLLSKSEIVASFEFPANVADLPSIFEGAALQFTVNTTTGANEVLRSGSGTSQVFAGVALDPLRFVSVVGLVESYTIPANGIVTLVNQAQSAGVIGALYGTTLLSQVGSNPVAGTSYVVGTATVNGNTVSQLTFNTADAGTVVTVQYRAVLSSANSAALYGDQYSRLAPDVTNTLSVITHGRVYTDAFDPTSVWNTSLLKITNGGIFAAQSSSVTGTNVNARMIQAPTTDFPFLGVHISAAN